MRERRIFKIGFTQNEEGFDIVLMNYAFKFNKNEWKIKISLSILQKEISNLAPGEIHWVSFVNCSAWDYAIADDANGWFYIWI